MLPLVQFRIAAPAIALFFLLLAGCGSSSPARFYTLNSLQLPEASAVKPPVANTVIVGIGPVTIPDYVDRPQIVTRSGQHELAMSEFDRWAGSLKSDISRILVENLSGMMAADGFTVVPWKRGLPVAARAAVDVNRMDIDFGAIILLQARWTIYAKDAATGPIMRESTCTEPLNGSDYGAAVAALSRAFGCLSRNIAMDFKTLAVEPSGDKNR
jgi:uncharacterized protein